MTSMESLEWCKVCSGTGRWGTLLGNALICETCGGSGVLETERCYLKS